MVEEILFILHVVNGIYIIIHNVIWYTYIYSNTCTNKSSYTYSNIFILILVQLSIISLTFFENIIIKTNFSRPFQRYTICQYYQKKFSLTYTMFEGIVSGFLSFFRVRFQLMFSNLSSLNSTF